MRTALIRDLSSYRFPRKLRSGSYGSYDTCKLPYILPSQSVCIFFTNFSFQIYFSTAENRHKNRILLQLAKIRLEWISQSNESIGRPLGFVIDRLFNTSASLYRIAPCLRACVLVICLHVFLYMYMYMLQSVWWKLILKLHVHVCKIVVTTC